MFEKNVIEKIQTHISCPITVVRKSCRFWRSKEKHCRAIQASDINMAHALCMLDTYVYIHTLSRCVILLAFLQQLWLKEIASMLRYTYISCPVHLWNTWSVNKVMRLIQYNSVFIFKPQIEFVTFKTVPLGGYTSPETLFPLSVAALEVAKRNRF